MTDKEFLDYCDSMTRTQRCGLVPSNIARLLRLAGNEARARAWDAEPNRIVDNCHDEVREFVGLARDRMERDR
jgi:hypothetical protein